MSFLFRRKKNDDEPVDLSGRSPQTGLKYSEVRDPLPKYPDQWALVCERSDAILDIEGVRAADDLFEGIAQRGGGDFDGWEAAATP